MKIDKNDYCLINDNLTNELCRLIEECNGNIENISEEEMSKYLKNESKQEQTNHDWFKAIIISTTIASASLIFIFVHTFVIVFVIDDRIQTAQGLAPQL